MMRLFRWSAAALCSSLQLFKRQISPILGVIFVKNYKNKFFIFCSFSSNSADNFQKMKFFF